MATGRNDFLNCTCRSSFNGTCFLLLPDYIHEEEMLLSVCYTGLHSARYFDFYPSDSMYNFFFCQRDLKGSIMCLCFTNQTARQSHDRMQNLSSPAQKQSDYTGKHTQEWEWFETRRDRTPLSSHSNCLPFKLWKRTAMSCAVICVCLNMSTFQPTQFWLGISSH